MKNYITLFALLLYSILGQAQTSKELVKSFNLEGNGIATVDLPYNVEVRRWANDYIQVISIVSLPEATEAQLRQLITLGRYDLEGFVADGSFQITVPERVKKNPTLTFGGKLLLEKVSYVVHAPEDIQLSIMLSGVQTGL